MRGVVRGNGHVHPAADASHPIAPPATLPAIAAAVSAGHRRGNAKTSRAKEMSGISGQASASATLHAKIVTTPRQPDARDWSQAEALSALIAPSTDWPA